MPTTSINRHLVSIDDLNREEIIELLDLAQTFKESPKSNALSGLLLGTCFYEPSTRTRLSFESAMKRLGGDVIGFSDGKASSFQKGESLADTMRVLSAYVDLIVLRHPLEGAANLARDFSQVPVINAGDGAHEHPTQTLLDLFSMRESQGKLDTLDIAIMGDLRYGRTVHSLVKACAHFHPRLYFVSPPGLELPDDICSELRRKSVLFSFHKGLDDVIDNLDILYLTRVQRERTETKANHQWHQSGYVLNPTHLANVKDTFKILHPLPRLDELSTACDASPYAYYFEQARNGIPVRQAVLTSCLGASL